MTSFEQLLRHLRAVLGEPDLERSIEPLPGTFRAGAGLGRVLGDPQFLEMFENVADAPASSPLTARFAVTAATLVDLSADDNGRENGEGITDMFLDFGDTPPPLLDEPLGLHFVFTQAEAVETFGTADGTLFDTEVAPAERRFYFKLHPPESWRSAPWPRHALCGRGSSAVCCWRATSFSAPLRNSCLKLSWCSTISARCNNVASSTRSRVSGVWWTHKLRRSWGRRCWCRHVTC